MELQFEQLKNEVMGLLDKHRTMVLATCADNRVTARMVSVVHRDLKLYFQTDLMLLKGQQMLQNPNVALCCNNIQIEGMAAFLGCWEAVEDKEILALYRKVHENSYLNYGHLPNQNAIEVTVNCVTLWRYEDGYALRDILYLSEQQAVREVYCKVVA